MVCTSVREDNPRALAIDILMFYNKYLTIHRVQMHAGTIRMLLYGLCIGMGDNPLAKAHALSSRTDARTYTCSDNNASSNDPLVRSVTLIIIMQLVCL